jgi:predicted O-linked N-acetylglucosamine transferase (SPINDLY family)
MPDPQLQSADSLIAEGNRAESAGNLQEACERYREAARVAPRYAKAHLNLGIGLEALGDAAGAIAAHEAALACDPLEPFASYNLGRLLHLRGDPGSAERLLRQALRSRPGFPEALVVLARVLAGLGRMEEAGATLEEVTRLADARTASGDLPGAASALEALLALRPDWTDALYNYGCVLKRLKRTAEAEAALARAIAADPSHAAASRMLGGVLREQCRTREALELYRAARERRPEHFELASAELYALLGHDGISEEELFSRHTAFGAAIERVYAPRFRPPGTPPDPERRLRVGYVSADFRYHVVTLFMLPVLERRDRSAFEVCCYSTTDAPDDYTRRVAGLADLWRDCAAASENELAERIRADRVDILVDLAGHSGMPQLRVFAQRPAPVQATWLGYLGTTGMTRMDYRITDGIADPPGATERFHTEALMRLPHSQWCYRPFVEVEAAHAPPCAGNGYVTFGSFNQAAKISPSARALWARILGRVPGARLLLAGVPPGPAQERLRRDFADAGVAPDRLAILPYVSLQDYFRLFAEVDIALDTMPYSGGTTTCDALWMGVPVVTAPGPRPASRSAASILSSAGLADWIAATPEDYVSKAVELAARPERLARLRASLRAELRASPLMDEPGFARALEALYRTMWRRWCAAPR